MGPDHDEDVLWTARRHGHDWRDEQVLAACDWLTSLVPSRDWAVREEAVDATFQAAKIDWASGRASALYNPKDLIGWYIHQARRYADPFLRQDFFEPEGFRIAPTFRRLGQALTVLGQIDGVEDRALRLMTEGRAQADDGIYELLVAAAYRERGWKDVAFVSEKPGRQRSPDLLVSRPRSSWAVECKRAGRSGYARDERRRGEELSAGAHRLSREAGRALAIVVRFDAELPELDDDYLSSRTATFLGGLGPYEWRDRGGAGAVFDLPWGRLLHVLQADDVYFGSSRMVQLVLGRYEPSADYSVSGAWTPAEGRPLHATSVEHLSLVAWTSASPEAARRKARHFRGVVGKAAGQLPGDRPGVVHVGYEALGGNSVDGLRHRLNLREMRNFDGTRNRLRWVYANYMRPQHVTARDESAAIEETTAWYRVGGAGTRQPLAGHLLFQEGDA